MNADSLSTRKYNALAARSRWSQFPATWSGILTDLADVLAALPIAAGVVAIEAHQRGHRLGRRLAERDAIDQGCIWDQAKQCLREISPAVAA